MAYCAVTAAISSAKDPAAGKVPPALPNFFDVAVVGSSGTKANCGLFFITWLSNSNLFLDSKLRID